MDLRDNVLAVLALVPNQTVPGRTVLQKLAYFCSVMTGNVDASATFRPHYYGPYSEPVARETSDLVGLGFLRENAEPVSGGVTRFTYSLSDDGRVLVGGLRETYAEAWEDVRNAVDRVTSHSVWRNTLDVSAAAKVHFILSMDEEPIDASSIEDRARKLGWELGGEKIREVIHFLEILGLFGDGEH